MNGAVAGPAALPLRAKRRFGVFFNPNCQRSRRSSRQHLRLGASRDARLRVQLFTAKGGGPL